MRLLLLQRDSSVAALLQNDKRGSSVFLSESSSDESLGFELEIKF